MKIIKPSFEIWDQQEGLEGIYKQIERCGRVCYASDPVEGKAKDFVDRMIKLGHGAMLEHSTLYLIERWKKGTNIVPKYDYNPYSKVIIRNHEGETWKYITTNYRVLAENDWMNDLQYLCEPTEFHEERITVKFICDRGVSHEFVRHRVFSFAQESTRYCNYSKDKFGNEITFIHPSWIEDNQDTYDRWCFYESLSKAEEVYFRLLKHGWTPQQARAVLPNSLKTELVMTGFVSDWKRFFRLRSRIAKTGKPHPQAQELADPLMDEFVKRGIMETLL